MSKVTIKTAALPSIDHDGLPIWSISIHPDSKRVATGGGDYKIKIWDFNSIVESLRNSDGDSSPSMPSNALSNATSTANDDKDVVLLAVLTNHTGAVNSVRWSTNGKYLGSCSDDKSIIIWELGGGGGNSTIFGQKNIEQWRVKLIWRQKGDVTDLCWSPDSTKVASCSIDGVIAVWDLTQKNPLATIEAHKGFVKGLAWDPIGRYIASQSDDSSVCLWRVQDSFKLETKVTAPYINSSNNVYFKRLSPPIIEMGCASRKDKNAHSESEDDGTEDGPVKSTNKTTANGDANRKGIVFEEAHAKLVIIGDTKCGKSSLVHRTLNDSFPTEISAESQITIAVDQNIIGTRKTITDHVTWNKMSRALVCEYNVGDQVLQRDNAVVRAFRGVFLVFAVDSRESFEKMKNFKLSLIQHYTFYVELVKYVIGLKVDVSNRAVSRDDAISFVETKNQEDIKEFGEDFVNWQYLELSAKDGTGIDDWKKELIKIISEF